MAAPLAAWPWLRLAWPVAPGHLQWDGRHWWHRPRDAAQPPRALQRLRIELAASRFIVLSAGVGLRRQWFCVTRRGCAAAWLPLRRALFHVGARRVARAPEPPA